jgi:thioesterase domain-containing protein/acyl carrier protein
MQHGIVQSDSADDKPLRRADLGLYIPWEEPRSETEKTLAEIWRRVFGMDTVGRLDDFFELGGDSFAATTMAAEIEATFGVRFAPGDIISLSTVEKQAVAIAPNAPSRTTRVPPYVVVGKAEGSKPPLFMVHGAGGFSFFKREFLDTVGEDRPIYLFQAAGLDGRTKPFKTVEQIAAAYVASMREIQPLGPYYLAAMCAGSFIALEMSIQLAEVGQHVARLILLDPQLTPPALFSRYPAMRLESPLSTFKQDFLMRPYIALRALTGGARKQQSSWEREQRKRANKLSKLEEAIQRRNADDSIKILHPEERSYPPEAMLEASLQLYDAVRTYVPRHYAGKATLLLSSKRGRRLVDSNASFWKDHLGGLDYEVNNCGHAAIFGAEIGKTAQLVRRVLDTPN